MISSKKCLYLLAALFFSTEVFAQTDAIKKEIQTAQEDALKVMVRGPTTIRFKDQANFSLPKGDGFVPAAQAARYLRAVGDTVNEKTLLGLVIPVEDNAGWVAMVALQQDGYVRDDDARRWKADDMLENLQNGTEQDNAARRERSIPELEVSGWAEQPKYDDTTHRLYWSAIVRTKGHVASDADFVNYRTIALGRESFLSLTMVTRLSQLAHDKPKANDLLADIKFDDGKRYVDFNSATDHIAEYGLGALIVGVAAKKLGLIAIILAFAAKFLKVGLLAAAAMGISIKKYFKRKPKAVPTPPLEKALPPVAVVTEDEHVQKSNSPP